MKRPDTARQLKRWLLRPLLLMLCLWMMAGGLLGALFSSSAQAQPADSEVGAVSRSTGSPAAAPVRGSGSSLRVTMPDVGDPNGYTLKTVRTQRDYPFTRPRGWKVLPSSRVHVSFQHSAALQAERSSLNVLVNDRILKTIRLQDNNIEPTAVDINIPPGLLKDNNILSFQVDQHYTYNCEDPFSAELWTTVLPDTFMQLDYGPTPVTTNLAELPYPLIDTLNNYSPNRIGYVVPDGQMSDGSLTAFAVTSAWVGQQAGWRDVDAFLASGGSSNSHLVVIGTPDENSAVRSLGKNIPDGLPADTGVIQLVRNPGNSAYAALIVSGNSPAGVAKAAYALSQKPANKLLVGDTAIITQFDAGEEHPYRAWDGFIQYSGDTFKDLGLSTMTARGITALPLYYQVNMMPDLFMPGKTFVKLKTVFSYSSQLSGDNTVPSRLEIMLNGKSIDDVHLKEPGGETLVTHETTIPAEEFHNYNEITYQFHLYPEKYDKCRFVTDAHIWGTIHNTSTIDMPAELKTPLPDVGMLNDGGFPFTVYQDLSHVTVVMPDSAKESELDVMLQAMNRLGRISQSKRGIRLSAHHAGSVPDGERKENHLIVIGEKDNNKMFGDFKGRFHLLMDGDTAKLRGTNEKLTELSYGPEQGVLEEVISPWNSSRVALALTGQNDGAMDRLAHFFSDDAQFASLEEGNIAVVNEDSTKSIIVMKQGDARFMYPQDLREGFNLPTWGWILVGFLALMGIFAIIRFLFGR